ncbi:hypothetical protein [Bradyrhizobium sp. S69]|uniref:hypothetical protein n=1 Tax=Bradyrhizobium sp. S69 TaxID=1641856 RepID=UPI00131B2E8A|nr:hypothetical protein [Bradyrhizobium sp. S69]
MRQPIMLGEWLLLEPESLSNRIFENRSIFHPWVALRDRSVRNPSLFSLPEASKRDQNIALTRRTFSEIVSKHSIPARKQCTAIIDQSISPRAKFFDNSNESGAIATVCNFLIA